MSERRDELRAADVDRTFVADLLKRAVDEGRLSLGEFDERLQRTYQARTYGDLDAVIADLPRPSRRTAITPATGVAPVAPAVAGGWEPKRGSRSGAFLSAAWRAWAVAVSVNIAIWLIVCVTTQEFIYFWPIWVAGPWGAALLAGTMFRRDHRD